MDDRPELRRVLHDLQSKTASLKGAAQLLKDCSPAKARELVPLMIQGAQELLQALSEYERLVR